MADCCRLVVFEQIPNLRVRCRPFKTFVLLPCCLDFQSMRIRRKAVWSQILRSIGVH